MTFIHAHLLALGLLAIGCGKTVTREETQDKKAELPSVGQGGPLDRTQQDSIIASGARLEIRGFLTAVDLGTPSHRREASALDIRDLVEGDSKFLALEPVDLDFDQCQQRAMANQLIRAKGDVAMAEVNPSSMMECMANHHESTVMNQMVGRVYFAIHCEGLSLNHLNGRSAFQIATRERVMQVCRNAPRISYIQQSKITTDYTYVQDNAQNRYQLVSIDAEMQRDGSPCVWTATTPGNFSNSECIITRKTVSHTAASPQSPTYSQLNQFEYDGMLLAIGQRYSTSGRIKFSMDGWQGAMDYRGGFAPVYRVSNGRETLSGRHGYAN